MILGFSTQIKEKPTYFIEKILKGLIDNGFYEAMHDELKKFIESNAQREIIFYHRMWDRIMQQKPKVHTIREDKGNRWKMGCNIDFFINVRKKNMFRFAPVLPVVSVQNIEIVYYTNREIILNDLPAKKAIIIDGKKRLNNAEIEKLALNDGFDCVDDFFNYFKDNFEGKIIHWTDLKY